MKGDTKMKSIGRRKFLKLTGMACLAGMVDTNLLTKHSYAEDENVLVVSEWGGWFQDALREAYFKPFTKKTGIKVIEPLFPLIRPALSYRLDKSVYIYPG